MRIMQIAICLGLLIAASAHAAEVARWSFEEGSGTTTADPVGGFTGTLTGGPMWSSDAAPVPSGSSFSLDFDGMDDFVDTAFGGIGGAADRSVSFWVKTTEVGDGIVGWGDDTTDGAKWHIRPNNASGMGRVVGAMRTEVEGGNQTGVSDITDGQWHHVVSVFSGSDNDDVVHWVDGRRDISSFAASQSVMTDNSNMGDAQPVTIGRRFQGGDSDNINGQIDEVRIFDSALSATEIRELFNGTNVPQAALDYNAANDTSPNNGNWEETHQLINAGGLDYELGSGVTHNADPSGAPPGITAVYEFDGTASATAALGGSGSNIQDDFPGDPTDNSVSFELWFRPETLSGDQLLFDFGGEQDGTSLTLSDDTLQFAVLDEGGNAGATAAGTTGTVRPDWNQAVGVLDLDNDEMLLYINGVLEDTMAYNPDEWAGGNGDGLGSLGVSSQVGAGHPIDGFFGDLSGFGNFQGDIGIFRLFNEALTQEDVEALRAAVIPEPSSIALWSLLGLAFAALGFARLRRQRQAAA